ncbi:hypothetical protein [Streptomyces violaceusniger]|uniref:Uncharacterized protein n=1 Tax=Streptomyces violaceusniger (strain Tu 4113) TaxID=653045 RepID=G2P4Q8_STRV4|nr:hypothetical protein [Streptomyces violaceusniger]AEM83947.1 hypothetical protein Strvi_4296 [Streptomyces violaceusniger Tu 4113]
MAAGVPQSALDGHVGRRREHREGDLAEHGQPDGEVHMGVDRGRPAEVVEELPGAGHPPTGARLLGELLEELLVFVLGDGERRGVDHRQDPLDGGVVQLRHVRHAFPPVRHAPGGACDACTVARPREMMWGLTAHR